MGVDGLVGLVGFWCLGGLGAAETRAVMERRARVMRVGFMVAGIVSEVSGRIGSCGV